MFEGLRGMLALPEDPNERAAAKQGLLALGGAMMSSRGQNFLGTVGDGLGAGAQGYQGALQQQQQQQYRQAQTQQIEMENKRLQAAADEPELFAKIMGGTGGGGQQSQAYSAAPSPQMGAPGPAGWQPPRGPIQARSTEEQYAFAMDAYNRFTVAGRPDKAKMYFDIAKDLRPKLMKQEARMVDGQRVMANVFEDGRTERVDGFSPDAEKLHFANTGGSTVGLDSFTGKPVNTIANSASPEAKLAAETARQASEAADRRSRDALSQGKTPVGYRWAADGRSLEAIPGGPVTAKTTEVQQKISDASTVLEILDVASPLIDRSTSSYGGAAVDQAARVFGHSTDGSEAAAQLKALEGSLVSKMPKMSGPQSDKDVLLYKQMAGQIGDPTIPAANKHAAMKVIREINERYLNQVQPQRVKTREELPKKATAPAGAPATGTVKGGYRFKGGNPAVQSNWEKV